MIFELLKRICRALEQNNIPYMLSGSIVMNVYAVPRMTRDHDIVVNLQITDIERFAAIFRKGYYIYEEGLEVEIRRRGMFNVIDYETGYKIDFIVKKNTEFHNNEFSRRRTTSAFGLNFLVVSLEDLILAKLIWIQQVQSEIQMNDIRNLMQNETIDMDYLKIWTYRLHLDTFNLMQECRIQNHLYEKTGRDYSGQIRG
jgi:hypothetical protein